VRGRHGGGWAVAQKFDDIMSDSQLTAIARLEERLDALKVRL
jgi:hypothetical protein